MADSIEDLLLSDEPPSQETIKKVHDNAMELLRKARVMTELAQARLKLVEGICKHPNKRGYTCPDCGYDNSPDGY